MLPESSLLLELPLVHVWCSDFNIPNCSLLLEPFPQTPPLPYPTEVTVSTLALSGEHPVHSFSCLLFHLPLKPLLSQVTKLCPSLEWFVTRTFCRQSRGSCQPHPPAQRSPRLALLKIPAAVQMERYKRDTPWGCQDASTSKEQLRLSS